MKYYTYQRNQKLIKVPGSTEQSCLRKDLNRAGFYLPTFLLLHFFHFIPIQSKISFSLFERSDFNFAEK